MRMSSTFLDLLLNGTSQKVCLRISTILFRLTVLSAFVGE